MMMRMVVIILTKVGATTSGVFLVAYVLAMEMVGPQYRSWSWSWWHTFGTFDTFDTFDTFAMEMVGPQYRSWSLLSLFNLSSFWQPQGDGRNNLPVLLHLWLPHHGWPCFFAQWLLAGGYWSLIIDHCHKEDHIYKDDLVMMILDDHDDYLNIIDQLDDDGLDID